MGADKSLVRPGRKQVNVSVRIAWISFGALPCRKKKNLMTARVSMLLKSRVSLTCFRACFLPGRAKDLSAPRYVSSKTIHILWNILIHCYVKLTHPIYTQVQCWNIMLKICKGNHNDRNMDTIHNVMLQMYLISINMCTLYMVIRT